MRAYTGTMTSVSPASLRNSPVAVCMNVLDIALAHLVLVDAGRPWRLRIEQQQTGLSFHGACMTPTSRAQP